MVPWEEGGVIECGGVTVRPGDAILADQDGAVVCPGSLVEEVIKSAHEREEIEVSHLIPSRSWADWVVTPQRAGHKCGQNGRPVRTSLSKF